MPYILITLNISDYLISPSCMTSLSSSPLSPSPCRYPLHSTRISHPVPEHFLHGCSPTLHGFWNPRWLPLHRHTFSLPLISDSTRQATPCHTVMAWRMAHQKKKKYIYIYIYIWTVQISGYDILNKGLCKCNLGRFQDEVTLDEGGP